MPKARKTEGKRWRRDGAEGWFIVEGRWFKVKISRVKHGTMQHIVLTPLTGYDHTQTVPWPYGPTIMISAKGAASAKLINPAEHSPPSSEL